MMLWPALGFFYRMTPQSRYRIKTLYRVLACQNIDNSMCEVLADLFFWHHVIRMEVAAFFDPHFAYLGLKSFVLKLRSELEKERL